MKRSFIFIIFILYYSLFTIHCLYAGKGTTAAEFLKFGTGARALGMAGAFGAVADDVFALYYNPAGLKAVDSAELGLMHNEAGEQIRQESVVYCTNSKKLKGVIAAGISYFTVSDIQGYNSLGEKTSTIESSAKLYTAGYAFSISQYLFAGIAVKSYFEKLDTYEAAAVAGDAGILYSMNGFDSSFLNRFRFGLISKNNGGNMKFIEDSFALPSSLTAAAAYDTYLYSNRLIITTDCDFPSGSPQLFSSAVEYLANESIAIRVGYKDGLDISNGLGLSAGAGLKFKNAVIDYAFTPNGDFSASHRLSLTFRFDTYSENTSLFDNIDNKFEKGKRCYEKGDLKGAQNELKAVLIVAPGHKSAREYLDKTEAEIEKTQTLKLVHKHLKLGKKFYNSNKLGDAQSEFETVLALHPGHEEALQYISLIKNSMLNIADSLFKRGLDCFGSNDFSGTISYMQKVIIVDPDNIRAKEYISLSEKNLKKIQSAKMELHEQEKLRRIKEKAADTFKTAVALHKRNSLAEAVNKYKEVLELDPNNEKAKQYMADVKETLSSEYASKAKISFDISDFETAGSYVESALNYNPDNENAIKLKEQITEALTKINKEKAAELNKTALLCYTNGNIKEAVELWDKSLKLDPESRDAQISLERAKKELLK